MEQASAKDRIEIKINRIKKRKLKNGETEYPKYTFVTIEEIFDVLTPENMNRFFRDFKKGVAAMVYLRAMIVAQAEFLAKQDGIELKPLNEDLKMKEFVWIDD